MCFKFGKVLFHRFRRNKPKLLQQFLAILAKQLAGGQTIDFFHVVGKVAEAMPRIGFPEPVGSTLGEITPTLFILPQPLSHLLRQ